MYKPIFVEQNWHISKLVLHGEYVSFKTVYLSINLFYFVPVWVALMKGAHFGYPIAGLGCPSWIDIQCKRADGEWGGG